MTDWLRGLRSHIAAFVRPAALSKRRRAVAPARIVEGLEARTCLSFTSVLTAGGVLTFTEPANTGDSLILSDDGTGLLQHNLTGGGYNSDHDFDPATAGDQQVALNAVSALANPGSILLTQLIINGGGGDDTVRLDSMTLAATTNLTIAGGAGTDGVELHSLTLGGLASAVSVTATNISFSEPGTTAITSLANQSYTGNVTLAANTAISTTLVGDIAFNGTVNGAFDLSLTAGTGDVSFTGAVGGGTRLGTLSIVSARNVTANALTVGALSQTAGTGTTALNGAVDANTAAGVSITTNTINVNAPITTTNNGLVTLNGITGLTIGAGGSIDASGAVNLSGAGGIATSGAISTAGTLIFGNNLTLGADTILASSGNQDVTFNGTVNGAFALTVNTGGVTTFAQPVGGGTALAALTTNPAGTTRLNGGSVRTTGAQLFRDDVVLGTNTLLTTMNSNITFEGKLDGAFTLGLTAGTGNVTLTGAVGGDTPLGTLTITTAGDVTANALTVAALAQAAGTGTTRLNGAVATTLAAGVNIAANAIEVNAPINTPNNGTVTLNAATTLTIAAAGDITADGAVSLTGGTGISTAGDVATTNDDVGYNSAVTLTGAVGVNTNTGAGNINFANTVNGGFSLTLTAGTGNVAFMNSVGGTTRLTTVAVNSSTDFTANAIFASVVSAGGTGTANLNGTINLTNVGAVNINSGNINLNAAIVTFGPAGVSLNATTNLVIAAAGSITSDGTVGLSGGAGITTAGNISTTGDTVSFNSNVTLTGSIMVNTGFAGAGTINFGGTVNGAFDLTLLAGMGNVIFNNAVGNTTRLGTLAINTASTVVANALTVAALSQAMGTGTTMLNGAVDANTAAGVSINANAIQVNAPITTTGAGVITLNATGALTINNQGNMNSDGAVNLTAGAGISTAGDVTTTNDNVRYNSNTTLTDQIAINTNAGAGDITFVGTLNGAFNLGLTAGTGNVTFTGAVGNATRLGTVTINSATNVDANALTVAALVQTAGTGTTTLNGPVNADTAAGVNIQTHIIAVKAAIQTAETGIVSLTADDTLSLDANGNILAGGTVDLTAANGITTAGDIVTTNDNVTFHSATRLTDDISISTDAAGGNITFMNTLTGTTAGQQDLALSAGTGDVRFNNVVGATELGALSIALAHDVTFDNTVTAVSLFQGNGSGTTDINGTVTTSGNAGVSVTTNAITLDADLHTTGTGPVTLAATAGAAGRTLVIAASGNINADGAVALTATDGISTAGDVTTSNDNVRYNSNTVLTGAVAIDTNAMAGDVTFVGTLNGAFDLTLAAGTGKITFTQNVGGITPLGDNAGTALLINSGANVEVGTNAAITMTLDGALRAAGAGLHLVGPNLPVLSVLTLKAGGANANVLEITGNSVEANQLHITGGRNSATLAAQQNRLVGHGVSIAASGANLHNLEITGNSGDGVEVTGATSYNNTILTSSIYGNTGIGIDLDGSGAGPYAGPNNFFQSYTLATGMTTNDKDFAGDGMASDSDDGPNHLQNYPEISFAYLTDPNDPYTFNISYSVPSAATYPLKIQFFLTSTDWHTGDDWREAQYFIGEFTYNPAQVGELVNIPALDLRTLLSPAQLAAIPGGIGTRIVATATDANNNTSEFSRAAVVQSQPLLENTLLPQNSADDLGVGGFLYTPGPTDPVPGEVPSLEFRWATDNGSGQYIKEGYSSTFFDNELGIYLVDDLANHAPVNGTVGGNAATAGLAGYVAGVEGQSGVIRNSYWGFLTQDLPTGGTTLNMRIYSNLSETDLEAAINGPDPLRPTTLLITQEEMTVVWGTANATLVPGQVGEYNVTLMVNRGANGTDVYPQTFHSTPVADNVHVDPFSLNESLKGYVRFVGGTTFVPVDSTTQHQIGFYLIQNGTYENLLAMNPGNLPLNPIDDLPEPYQPVPQEFFSFRSANQDNKYHLRFQFDEATGQLKLYWADQFNLGPFDWRNWYQGRGGMDAIVSIIDPFVQPASGAARPAAINALELAADPRPPAGQPAGPVQEVHLNLSVSDVTVVQGAGVAQATISRDDDSGPLTITLTHDAGTTIEVDGQSYGPGTSAVITLQAGQRSASVTITNITSNTHLTASADGVENDSETVSLTKKHHKQMKKQQRRALRSARKAHGLHAD